MQHRKHMHLHGKNTLSHWLAIIITCIIIILLIVTTYLVLYDVVQKEMIRRATWKDFYLYPY